METRFYKKDGIIKSFFYDDGKIIATIQIGGNWVSNPQESALLAEGWERYTPTPPQPYVPTYEEKVVNLIRLRYDENDEAKYSRWNIEVTILKRKTLTEEEVAELTAYSEYVAWCHEEAIFNL